VSRKSIKPIFQTLASLGHPKLGLNKLPGMDTASAHPSALY
jgi:hypothetical protein